MTNAEVKKRIVTELNMIPQKYLSEVYDFLEFLKLREDEWFINYINQRTKAALQAKKTGKKFYLLKEIQKEYA